MHSSRMRTAHLLTGTGALSGGGAIQGGGAVRGGGLLSTGMLSRGCCLGRGGGTVKVVVLSRAGSDIISPPGEQNDSQV